MKYPGAFRYLASAFRLAAFVGLCPLLFSLFAQTPAKAQLPPTPLKVGERLTYHISFEGYNDVGFAETFVVSRGKLGEADVIELRFRVKTSGLVSAAFYQIDEMRTAFVSADAVLPLYVKRTDLAGVSPKETVSNYLTAPAAGLDLLSLIYRVRLSGGVGSFMLSEGDRNYPVTLQPVGGERVKTDAGEFDTTIASVESEYFTELGLKGLRINFSNDEARLPVLVRFRSLKGDFRATLSGVHLVEPEPEPVPTPAPQQTPRVTATPRPVPSPTPYIENLPLAAELGFSLGETLRYRVSAGDRALGEIALRVKERKQFKGEDTLLLSIDVTAAEQGNGAFSLGDSIVTHVDPETLVPRDLIVRASGPLSFLNRSADFDQRSGTITFAGSPPVDAPVGTHNIVSLLYAIRSFNLKPSKDMNNPVNDTRVAVFWHEKAYVFTLRPGDAESLTINEKNISAQRIAVNTGVSSLDQGGIKIWLSNDSVRRPVRFSFGVYQADLIHEPKTQLK